MNASSGDRVMVLEKFDPASMKPNRTSVFVGRPGMGKSTLMLDVAFHNRLKYEHGIAMSGTDQFTGFWEGCVPPTYVFEGFSTEGTGSVIAAQTKMFNEEFARMRAENPLAKKEDVQIPHAFIIDEDNLASGDINTDRHVRTIMMNGRHLKIGYYLAIQYLMALQAKLRGQVGYVFILYEVGKANRRRIHEAYFGMIEEFDDFCDVMDWATEDNRCLVLDLTVKTNDYRKCVFWYMAKVRPSDSFKLGSPAFWGYHLAANDPDGDSAPPQATAHARRHRNGPLQVVLSGRRKPGSAGKEAPHRYDEEEDVDTDLESEAAEATSGRGAGGA